ncbi:MAG: hypothetical protein IJ935_07295 [Afipia sp.]|nr:hypothetical protein [Afipia sp.]
MLYDPKWEKNSETKTDPFSLESLIAWLEKQPADKAYNFCDKQNCLIAQYLQAAGVEQYELSSAEVASLGWMQIVNPKAYVPTFGAALERARAALADRA